MIIRQTQYQSFKELQEKHFLGRCVQFLRKNFPNQFSGKQDDEMIAFVESVLHFGSRYEIQSEINIQKLLVIQLKYDFLGIDPLDSLLVEILTYPARTEDEKTKYFHKQLIFSHVK